LPATEGAVTRGAPDDLLTLAEILSFPFIRLALPSLAL
jgi:hypothetical protein